MRIADEIASSVIGVLEYEEGIVFSKERYLEIEDMIAMTIADELAKWLLYDVHLNEFNGEKIF